MPQYARPDATDTPGSWAASAGTIHGAVDEVSSDTADYIYAPALGNTLRLSLSAITDPGVDTGITARFTAQMQAAHKMTVQLIQGASTVIDTWEHTGAGAVASYSHSVAEAAAANITNYADLSLEFTIENTFYDLDASADEIAENAAIGDSVGIQVFGIFPGTNPVTYSITTQSTPGAFAVNATTGVVTVATAGLLDYESRPTETVTVRATDTVTTAFVDTQYTITVGDVTANLNELWGADPLVWLTDSGAEPSVWRI